MPILHEHWTDRKTQFDLPAFREMVCELGCVVHAVGAVIFCGCDGPIDPHHTPGKTERPADWSDTDVIGLCRYHHNLAEKMGDESFRTLFELDYREIQRGYVIRFLRLMLADRIPETKRTNKASKRKNRVPFDRYELPENRK